MPTRFDEAKGGGPSAGKKPHEASAPTFDAGIDMLFGTSYARPAAPAAPPKPRVASPETTGMTLSRKDDRRPGRRF